MISIVVAMSENRVIGRAGEMPWRMSNDLKRFKRITMGHHIVMGRKTFDSIGRPLPGRTSVVISRTATYDDPQIKVARSLPEAIEIAGDDDEIFITGGAQIYAEAVPLADRIYLTQIHCEIEDGDTFFPEIDWRQYKVEEDEAHLADEKNEYNYNFLIYERISDA